MIDRRKLILTSSGALIGAAGPGLRAKTPLIDSVSALFTAITETPRGDVLHIPTGRYALGDLKIEKDIALIGQGIVEFFAPKPIAKGIINTQNGASLRVQNIQFRSAAAPDQNGAGIRHDGEDLTIVNCRFIDNENGVLATGAKKGRIRIRSSAFIGNGHGDGYSHGVYAVRGSSLDIAGTEFIGTRIGHHVKTLTKRTRIYNCTFKDAAGQTSYAVDAQKGGDIAIMDSVFERAADADNETLINYDLSRGGAAIALVIKDNSVFNEHSNANFLRNKTRLKPVLENNQLINRNGARMRGL